MVLRFFFFFFVIMHNANYIFSQCNLRYSGKIMDSDTQELLEGATIEIKEINYRASTKKEGVFKIEGLCPGHYDVIISHVGCETLYIHIDLKNDFLQDYALPHASGQLREVTLNSAGKLFSAMYISGRDLEASRGLTLGESLKKVTGVSVLQTGSNIYKPVIHGMHSNRVLILNNGIRQEGQQWGNDHAPEVDPYIADRVAVIKGAATIRFGGDAIGGAVIIEPKPLRSQPGVGGEINLGGFSNNRMGVMSGIFDWNAPKRTALSLRLQGTVKRAGNAKTPNYWLSNSGMAEYNFSSTAGWRKKKWGTELFYSQFNTKIGIFSGSHIGNLTDLMNAITNNEPPDYIRDVGFSYVIERPYQDVQHHLLKSKTFFSTGNIGRLNIIGSFQYNNRKEYDKKRFQSSEDVPQLDFSIATGGLDVVWDHFTINKFRGTVGVTGSFQDNWYSRRFFIPNYQSASAGIFMIEKWEKNKWLLEGGIRFDYRNFFNISSNAGRIFPDREYSNLSGNTGATYNFNKHFQLIVNLSSAWRNPNINELFSDGLHHGVARIEKGDSRLTTERANSVMSSLIFSGNKLSIDAGFYIKYVNNFIFLEPTFPPQLTIRGSFPSFRFSQTNARLHGADISINYEISNHLRWVGKASLIRAWNKTTNDWLIQMPADRFENELDFSFRNNKFFQDTYSKLTIQNILQQSRTPSIGLIEITRPDGSKYFASDYSSPPPAYVLIGFEMGTQIQFGKSKLNLIFSASNLLNYKYRDYMNAFRYFSDEMGRNISIRIKLPFNFTPDNQKNVSK